MPFSRRLFPPTNAALTFQIGWNDCARAIRGKFTFTGALDLVWFGFLRIYVDLAVFQPYLDLEAGDNQSLKIQVARPGIEPRSSCSAS